MGIKDKIKTLMKSIFPAYRVALRLEAKFDTTGSGYRLLPKPMLTLEVQLTEHCNLNCAYCDHFSSIAEPEFLDISGFERDMARLSSLFDGQMQFIKLMGGEPLLHPQVTDFIRIAREYFPIGHVLLVTNGMLLPKQPEEFWLACRAYDLWITPTKYPCNIDYASSEKLAEKYGVRYLYYGEYIGGDNAVKTMNKHLLNLDAQEDPRCSFLRCNSGNNCLFLQHGRMYTCPVCPTSRHFSKRFGVDLHISKGDSVDIHQAESGAAILEFLSKPIPFCRYCNNRDVERGLPWKQTDKSISEWTL